MLLEFLLHGSRYNKQKPIGQGKLFHREQNRIVQRGKKKEFKTSKTTPPKNNQLLFDVKTHNLFIMSIYLRNILRK